jgi:5'-nucleotidase
VANFNTIPVAKTAYVIDGTRELVRTQETNAGNLVADALVWNAVNEADNFGIELDNPIVGVQNGGGIRNSVVVTSGTITAGDIADMLPFGNNVSVVEDLPVQNLVAALENAVSRVEFVDGRFLQVAGLRFSYDPSKAPGSRVVDAFLEGSTMMQIVDDGAIIRPDQLIDLVTIDFLLGDRDGFDWDLDGKTADDGDTDTIDFAQIPVNYDQALTNYLVNALNGEIEGLYMQYMEGGEGRIKVIPEPATLAVMGLGMLAMLPRRRNRKA